MDLITNVLYWLSNGMLVPDIIFLLFFFVKSLIMIGGFYGAYITRTKVNVKLNRDLEKSDVEQFLRSLPEADGKNRLNFYFCSTGAEAESDKLHAFLLDGLAGCLK